MSYLTVFKAGQPYLSFTLAILLFILAGEPILVSFCRKGAKSFAFFTVHAYFDDRTFITAACLLKTNELV